MQYDDIMRNKTKNASMMTTYEYIILVNHTMV